MPTNAPLGRKLRMGLVGGGQGAFIGRVHATAAVLDNRAALVAGALSSDPKKAQDSAADYDIPADRAYGSFKEMADADGLPAEAGNRGGRTRRTRLGALGERFDDRTVGHVTRAAGGGHTLQLVEVFAPLLGP